MFVIVARYYIKEGAEKRAVELLKSIVPLARNEPGCITYTFNQSVDDPRQLMMFERFIDEAASLHMQQCPMSRTSSSAK